MRTFLLREVNAERVTYPVRPQLLRVSFLIVHNNPNLNRMSEEPDDWNYPRYPSMLVPSTPTAVTTATFLSAMIGLCFIVIDRHAFLKTAKDSP